jgi:zinc protease
MARAVKSIFSILNFSRTRIIVIVLLFTPLFAFPQRTANINLNDSIPLDPEINKTILSNGFTYYLERNTSQPGKAHVQFIVKAGSLQTDQDQTSEMPHIFEHISFRIAPHLKGYEQSGLQAYLKDINAVYNAFPDHESTFFVETVSSDTSVLRRLTSTYRDWISGRSILKKEVIDAEKNVIMAERVYRGAIDMTIDQELIGESRYAEVLRSNPTSSILNRIASLPVSAVRRFYKDWYRPNLSGLVVVGDIDVAAMDQIVRNTFAGLQNPANERTRLSFPVRLNGQNKFISLPSVDDAIWLSIIYLREKLPNTSYGHYKEFVLTELVNKMLRQADDGKFDGVGIQGTYRGSSFYRMMMIGCTVPEGKFIEEGIKSCFTKEESIRRFGFSEMELNNAKKELVLQDRPDEDLVGKADRCRVNFVDHEAAPSTEWLDSMRTRFLTEITLEETNQYVSSWLTEHNRIIAIQAPERANSFVPKEDMIMAWREKIRRSDTLAIYRVSGGATKQQRPGRDIRVNFDSLYQLPPAVSYTRKDFQARGIVDVQLENGLRVILKSALSKTDDVIFLEAVRPAGAMNVEDADYYPAIMASRFITGLGELNLDDLTEYKRQQGIRSSFNIENNQTTITGRSKLSQFETLLQVTWRYFLDPPMDNVSFCTRKDELVEQADNRKHSGSEPASPINRRVESWENVAPSLSSVDLVKVRYERVLQAYQTLFGTPAEFMFVITGVQDIDKTIGLVAKYLGNIPITAHADIIMSATKPEPLTLNVNKTVINKSFKSLHGAEVRVMYVGREIVSVQEEIRLQVLNKVLESVCEERLRDREHGIYAIHGSFNLSRQCAVKCSTKYQIGVRFKCLPKIRNRLIKAVRKEVKQLQKDGPSPKCLERAIEEYKKPRNPELWDDKLWAYFIINQLAKGEDFQVLYDLRSMADVITPKDIQRAAQEYLQKRNFISYAEIPKD